MDAGTPAQWHPHAGSLRATSSLPWSRGGVVTALLEAVPEGVIVVDESGRVAGWNAHAAAIFGWSAAEALKRSAVDLVVPVHLRDYASQRLAWALAPRLAPRTSYRLEAPLLARDGSEVPAELSLVALRTEVGPAVVAFVHDLREQRRAESAVRESERRLRQIIDLVPHFIFAKDAAGRFLIVNRAVADAYGTTVNGLLGKGDADFAQSAEQVAQFRRDDIEVIRGGKAKAIAEESLTDASGATRILETIKIPFPFGDSGETAVLGVATDVTERKRVEAELIHAQKMEGIGRLAGGVAHDFNNLLTAILGYVQLLESQLPADSALRRDTAPIRDAAERATSLTRQLLTFARRDQAQPRPVDLTRLILGLDRLLRRVIGADVELVTLPSPGDRVVEVDPGQMEQVVVNLIVNARDAMPQGGKIVIATREACAGDPGVPPADVAGPGPWVELSVSDTGTGMAPDVLSRAFEPFFTTKGPGTGTGLGLAICYGIVKRHGGHIWAESAVGQGTTFRILLPRAAGVPPPPAVEPDPSAPRGTETILVVDDDESVRDVVVRALEGAGYTVLSAGTATGTLALAKRHPSRIHLLVADVVMPAMSGPEVAERFLVMRPDARVLFVSGFHDSSHVRRGTAPAAGDLLAKPFTPAGLVRKVREVLDRMPVSANGNGNGHNNGKRLG